MHAQVRALTQNDLQNVRRPNLGSLLQLLIAHGDDEFVASIYDTVEARVAWLLEREYFDQHPTAKKFNGSR